MKTFAEELEAALVQTMIDEGMFDWFGKKKPASPTTPTSAAKLAKPMKPYRTGKNKDSAHYRTDHHYGYGDIDPETIPVFKSSLSK